MNSYQHDKIRHLSFPNATGSVGLNGQRIGMIHNHYRELSYKYNWYFVPNSLNHDRYPIGEFATETKDDLHTLVRSMVNDTLEHRDHSARMVGIKQSEDWLVVNSQKIGLICKDGLWPYPWQFLPCSSYAGPFAIRNFSVDTRNHLVTLVRCWITDLWRARNHM